LAQHGEPSDTDPNAETPPVRQDPLGEETIPVARPIVLDLIDPPGSEMLLTHSSTPAKSLMDIGILVLLLFAAEVVAASVFLAVGGDEQGLSNMESETSRLLVPLLTVRLVVVLTVVWLILKYRCQSVRSIGVTNRGLLLNLPIGGLTAACAGGCNFVVMTVLLFLFPSLLEQMIRNAEQIDSLMPDMPILATGGVMLMVGVWEEVFFRGFLMTRIRRATNSWVLAVLISTAVFVLPHLLEQTPAAMIPIAVLSLVFSLVTIWRRSIIPAIVAHAIYNLTVLVYLTFYGKDLLA